MKIVVINADRGIAPDGSKGAAVHLRSITRAFRLAGAEVLLFSRRMPQSETAIDAPVRDLEDLADHDADAFDFVYERYSLGHREGLTWARDRGLPFALEVNAPLVQEAGRHRPDSLDPDDSAAERWLWRDADLVFAVSSGLGSFIAGVRGHDQGLFVLPNGIDPELFSEEPRNLAGPPYRLGFLGHPKPWHGTDALLDLSLALCGRGIDARLVVIGGGPGAGELRRAFEEKGLGDRVEVTGPLSQEAAITVYRGCHVGLAPYEDRDDFYFCPLKVLESLAAGVPLVASRIGDIPDLVQDAAWLVEPGHREALADTVAAALANPDARHDLARRGRARVLGNYVWQRHAERILDAVMALKTSR